MKKHLRLDRKLKRYIGRKRNCKRDISFELPPWYVALVKSCRYCFYTGKKFTNSDPLTLERIDNNLPYVIGNVIPVCKTFNSIKSDLCGSDIVSEIEKIEERLESIYTTTDDYYKNAYKTEEIIRDYLDLVYTDFPKDYIVSKVNKLANLRKNIKDCNDNIIKLQKRVNELELVLTASEYYSSLSENEIIKLMVNDENFDPVDKFNLRYTF